MATKKITDLVELTSAASGDVLPIVDISEDITKKIQVINFPISTATQTAIDAKQDTLVSGTNIKTINSTSLLGSGDISIEANPSGGAGAIQFSDGSAFASDDTNLFWDNTNKWLGVGTTTPSARLHVKGSGSTSATTPLLVQNSTGTELARFNDDGSISLGSKTSISTIGTINTNGNLYALGGSSVQVTAAGSFRFVLASQIWNDADGTMRLSNWADNGFTMLRLGGKTTSFPGIKRVSNNIEIKNADDSFGAGLSVGAALNASAILQASSTTKGFLPPVMTTTQKNAIATPASGLQVYDTTLNQMSYYNGTSWVNF